MENNNNIEHFCATGNYDTVQRQSDVTEWDERDGGVKNSPGLFKLLDQKNCKDNF